MPLRIIFILFILVATCVFPHLAYSENKAKKVVIESDFTYDDQNKRDPFWPLVGHNGTIISYDKDILASDLILEGVMAEPTGESIAIINGNIVKLGEKIGLYIVKEIQVNTVILEKGQEIFTLKLKKEE